MNKHPTQAEVRRTIKRLIPEFGLERWTVGLTFERMDEPDALAGCNPNWEYLDVRLAFDLHHDKWLDPSVSLTKIVAHELAHCLVNPLAVAARDGSPDKSLIAKVEEMVVTHIERLPFIERLEDA